MNATTRKVVLAAIEKDGKFLIIKPKSPLMKGTWAFPGGIMKDDETEEEAVIREVKEEVDLDVEIKNKLFSRKHPNTLVELVYFHCVPKDSTSEPKILEEYEIEKCEWVDPEEVLKRFTLDVDPRMVQFLKSF